MSLDDQTAEQGWTMIYWNYTGAKYTNFEDQSLNYATA